MQESIFPTILNRGETLHFSFKNIDEAKTITIADLKGLIYKSEKVELGQSHFNLSTRDLPSGLLFVEITYSNRIRYEKIFIK